MAGGCVVENVIPVLAAGVVGTAGGCVVENVRPV